MKFTVADALKLFPLSKGKVIAGHNGLSNEITSVSVLEITEDSVMKFIRPGQLEISAFYSVANDEAAQLNAIRMLKKCQVSGLMLSHVGLILKVVPKSMIDICNELKFPLILMPQSVEYIEIISPILDRLLKIQNQQLAYAMDIYDKMAHLILEEQDFDCLVSTLSSMINRQVLFFNHKNVCVANAGADLIKRKQDYIVSTITENLKLFLEQLKELSTPAPDNSGTYLFAPVVSSRKYYGVVVILDAEGLNELDHIAIGQTKNALGIITINKINLKDYDILLRHDFINDLVQWNFPDEYIAIQRGLALNYDITKLRAAMVLDLYRFANLSSKHSEEKLLRYKADFFKTVQAEMDGMSPDSILMNFSDKILILFSGDKMTKSEALVRFKSIGRFLIQVVRERHGLEISAGIGRYCDNITLIRQSYLDARTTLSISKRVFGGPRCSQYDEIKVYSLLCENANYQGLNSTLNNLFLPLREYDEANNAQLLLTFKNLLENDLDTSKVAEIMFLHRNTILLRKKKISELYDYDPYKRTHRMQFEVGILLETLIRVEDKTDVEDDFQYRTGC